MHASPDPARRAETVSSAPDAEAHQPYLVVVGCPRSGTTLLQRMLDHHPQLAVANDTHFVPRCLEKTVPELLDAIRAGDDPALTGPLVESVRTYHRFGRLGLAPGAVDQAAGSSATYGQFVAALYMAFCRQHGKPLAGEKTPDYVRHLPLLAGLLPWIKTVHIYRDGRDVALSTQQWAHEKKGPGRLGLWQREPVAVSALWWQWLVTAGRRDGRRLGPSRYAEVKYESLTARPEAALEEVAGFLQLPYEPQMLAYHEGKPTRPKAHSAKSAWLPPTPGLRDWRTQMQPRDLELFEALAGDTLSELGYDRGAEEISPGVAAVAESCRQWWQTEGPRPARQAATPCATEPAP